jgi:putative endopeptidase
MKSSIFLRNTVLVSSLLFLSIPQAALTLNETARKDSEPRIPRFSVDYMDKSVSPGADFYKYAVGNWLKNNPVPPDKSRYGAFDELNERNSYMLHAILENAEKDASAKPGSPLAQVGDFFASAMDTQRLEKLGFKPIEQDLSRIEAVKSTEEMFKLLADFHKEGISGIFRTEVEPDEKESTKYAFQMAQGGLSMPDRDYYLSDNFSKQREAYVEHVKKMFMLPGESAEDAAKHAATVMNLETELARASRTRVDLRDPIKNYNKTKTADLIAANSAIPWKLYFESRNVDPPFAIVGQPEFFAAVDKLLRERPLADWKAYMRWHVLHDAAPYLHDAAEVENFNFFGKVLSGQQEQEPRWKRAAKVVDGSIGEALGKIYVEKYFPPEARTKMNDLVNNLREVFVDHLKKLDWMSDATRQKALAKFNRFTHKIGYPEKFRDYSAVKISRDDYLGNVRRADAFEVARRTARLGKTVDRSEWEMTPPTVNAYFNPPLNEIVFPAGILQPPFFDLSMDDAINYGAIAVVIGHEITHGYDDKGRLYDADGNLNEWWTEKDAKEFDTRAQKIVDEYDHFEALPGLFVNGKLTVGENIADLGGISIAYDALERVLKKDPSKRKLIDGLTPEQRFFISFAQVWRTNIREAEQRKRITVDPHSPGRFRAFGPLLNFEPFYDAFSIKESAPIWRAPELRAHIW